jgi:hypothetical protein
MTTIEEKRAQRFRFMQAVYEQTQGDRFRTTQVGVIAHLVGLDEKEADDTAQYLVDEGMLGWAAFQGVLEITHRGVVEVELALSEPAQPTQHFPPINFIHIERMTDSQIQLGTTASAQTMTNAVTPDDRASVLVWLAALRQLELAADAKAEADAQIATIEAQVKSKKPVVAILRAARAVLLPIITGVGTAQANELIKRLPDILK